jgi:hypothetical protein
MTTREKVELLLICIVAAAAWFFAAKLPHNLRAGEIILAASGILLFQGLLRDLWIKYVARPPAPVQPRKIMCMCMESTVGASGVIAGAAILLCGIRHSVDLPQLFWPLLILIVGIVGFAIKDLVIDWKTWRVRKEKDHQSVIPW